MSKLPEEYVKVHYGAWIFGLLFMVIFFPLMFFAPTASNYIYSYLLQPNPGTLYSERWDYNFFVTGSIILLVIAPTTLFLLVAFPARKSLRVIHVIIVVVLIIWYLISFAIGCVNWNSANVGTVSNFYNKANDARWCCVYWTLTGSPCPQAPCNPNCLAAQLTTDALFLFQLWYIFVLALALIGDLVFFLAYVRVGLEAYDDLMEDENKKDIEQQIPFIQPKPRAKSYRPKSTY
jgi:hypothetical protein